MAKSRFAFIAILFAAVMAVYSSAFTVDQTQQALVLQLGEPKRTIQVFIKLALLISKSVTTADGKR
jgi:regulator of protease activity HflC (stomatin/prohibitin superfamily)